MACISTLCFHEISHENALVVDHVFWSCTKLLVAFDDLVHSIKEVLLRDRLPSSSDSKHPSFGANASYISP